MKLVIEAGDLRRLSKRTRRALIRHTAGKPFLEAKTSSPRGNHQWHAFITEIVDGEY